MVIIVFFLRKSGTGLDIYSNFSQIVIEDISNVSWVSDCFIINCDGSGKNMVRTIPFQIFFRFLMFSWKNLGKYFFLLFLIVLIKDFCIVCVLCGFPFLQEYFNLINFDRNCFLIDIDCFKPRVIYGLSLNFNLLLDFFLEVHKCQVKAQIFERKFHKIFQCLC